MKFVEHPRVRRKVSLQISLNLRITCALLNEPMPDQHAARISVRHEEGFPPGVEQNSINRFRPEPTQLQKLTSEPSGRRRKHAGKRSCVMAVEPGEEILNGESLLTKEPCRANARFKFVASSVLQPVELQQTGLTAPPD